MDRYADLPGSALPVGLENVGPEPVRDVEGNSIDFAGGQPAGPESWHAGGVAGEDSPSKQWHAVTDGPGGSNEGRRRNTAGAAVIRIAFAKESVTAAAFPRVHFVAEKHAGGIALCPRNRVELGEIETALRLDGTFGAVRRVEFVFLAGDDGRDGADHCGRSLAGRSKCDHRTVSVERRSEAPGNSSRARFKAESAAASFPFARSAM